MNNEKKLTIRAASISDVSILTEWNEKPHVKAAISSDGSKSFDVNWGEELQARTDGTEILIAEVDGSSIGAMQIIDPATERTHYWGAVENNLRAIDIWIGEQEYIGRGYGSQMMEFVIEHCFSNSMVNAILIDPLVNNTRSHRFYLRLGFEFVERRQFSETSDCFIFRLSRERRMKMKSQDVKS